MTKITIDLTKSLHENAGEYFDKAKKAKAKVNGATIALERTEKKLARHLKKGPQIQEGEILKKKKKREWFEKFRWFYSSEGFLVIGGRDATTNEIVIKKYTDKDDIVFHTDMAGSPFFVIKSEGKEIGENTLQEVCNATACFSRAWKKGLSSTEVFYVKPEQVTKQAKAGESLSKGSFMIMGKTTYIKPEMKLGIGIFKEKAMAGAIESIKNNCEKFILVIQGDNKPSDIAKEIKKTLKHDDLDEIIRALPSGGCKVLKE